MDYEKAYKEALERARKCLDEKRDSCFVRPDVIFPELKESEDERIRKALIGIISNYVDDSNTFKPKMIAWLEKQGEKKLTNNVEPKFKVGEEMKFRKFDIITNGKIEYEIKDIQKNQLGDWVYILHNDSISRLVLPLSSLPDGSIRWVCEQVDKQFELKQRMEEQQ